jgi:membrane protein implicated in regulation of membrane protease activity
MTQIDLYQWTLFLALMFVVVEMLTGTFLFLGFGMGTLPLVFIHYSTEQVDWGRDLAVFAVVSTISFFLLRKRFRNRNDTKKLDTDVNIY